MLSSILDVDLVEGEGGKREAGEGQTEGGAQVLEVPVRPPRGHYVTLWVQCGKIGLKEYEIIIIIYYYNIIFYYYYLL